MLQKQFKYVTLQFIDFVACVGCLFFFSSQVTVLLVLGTASEGEGAGDGDADTRPRKDHVSRKGVPAQE